MNIQNNIKKVHIIVFMLLFFSTAVYAQITEFNAASSQIDLLFPNEFMTNNFFIRVPNGTVTEARMRLQGFDILGQSILPADVILVTDTSGSMRFDCGPDQQPQAGETPCKINDAKVASLSFLDNVNLNYIHVGLVEYSTCPDLDQVLGLTDDRDALEQEIDSYEATSATNMGMGMELAIDELLGPRAQDTERKYLLVITDGIANRDENCLSSTSRARAYVRAQAQRAANNNIILFGVAFGECGNLAGEIGADCVLVNETALTTGGTYYHAPDATSLLDIYNQIAQQISVQDFPTPDIDTTSPVSMDGWRYPAQYSTDLIWNLSDCGNSLAVCSDFRDLLQQNLDQCPTNPCDIDFSVYSTTVGQLTLSELFIEINEPPVGNYPPIGNCRDETMTCGDTDITVDIDDGSMVTDPNDDLDTLNWVYNSSIKSSGGSYLSYNSNFNTIRTLTISVDLGYLYQSYWETFFFNISDPWGESTISCLNVSYEGCSVIVCGDGIQEGDEECDDGNLINTDACTNECENAECGDSILWIGQEECDDGARIPGDGCDENCQLEEGVTPFCPNGVWETGEECDDGNYINTDACLNTCDDASCGDGYVWAGQELCDDGNQDDGDGCSSTCGLEANLEITDRTVSFDYSAFPGYEYYLTNMIDTFDGVPCGLDELGYRLSDSNNFIIIGPNSEGKIIIIPNDPGWFDPTSESIQVEIYCDDSDPGGSTTTTIYGNADVILVTDFSGSMKKAVDSWDQGTGITNCEQLYSYSDARKSHLARCLDSELVQTVMSYENNRIWPIFIHNDEILYYPDDPEDIPSILNYIDSPTTVSQGDKKTCLACAINQGYDILDANSGSDRNKFIVFMTDGVPTHCAQGACTSSSSTYGDIRCNGFCDTNGQDGCGENAEGCDDNLCQAAEGNTLYSMALAIDDLDVMFYTVGFGLVEDCSRAELLLGQIATMSGGEYHHSKDVNELRQIYDDIAQKILSISEVNEVPGDPVTITDTATLNIIYTAPSVDNCGNGLVEYHLGEECDDANDNNDDLCTNICTLTNCGDNILQQPNGEGTGGLLGNGVEECDDGNIYNGDGCNDECVIEFCGDSYIQPALFEECDDGNTNNGDGCDENCELEPGIEPECGNSILEYGETCDDGNTNNGDGCDENCQLEDEPGCGNSQIEEGETCDDGNTEPGDGCDENCQLEDEPGCGNEVREQGEDCDDGCLQGIPNVCEDVDDDDGCDQYCQLEVPPGCGNGVEEAGETCDDGNTIPGDGCDENCQLEDEPVLSILDTTISFGFSAYPGYSYNLADMLSVYAILPCNADELVFQIADSTNFEITGPDPDDPLGNIVIVPVLPDGWFAPTLDTVQVDVSCSDGFILHSDTADLTIIYTAEDAPEGNIECYPDTPRFLLHDGEAPVDIDVNDIFDFMGSPGDVTEIDASSYDFIITTDLPNDRIRVSADDTSSRETVDVGVTTNLGISENCPVILMNINSNCDDADCDGCSDFDCLATNGCLDQQIIVPNPFALLVPGTLLPAYAQSEDFTVPSFTSPPDTYGNSFIIYPSAPPERSMDQLFMINGSYVGHANMSAAIIEYNFDDYQSNRPARICPGLMRLDYDIGETVVDPETDLLISGSKSVIGFYEIAGLLFSKGPYIFTAKVWLRD